MKKIITTALGAASLLICTNGHAQTTTNGTWLFQDQQSVSGNLYSNGSPAQLTVNQMGTDLALTITENNGKGDTTYTEQLSTAKLLVSKTVNGRRKTIFFRQSAADHFTVVTSYYDLQDNNKVIYRNTDIYTFANGSLVVDRKSENFTNSETWESKANYTRQ